MSNDDKRRRQDGSTAKLSVADLIARREAETQPIPRVTYGEAANRTTYGEAVTRTADGRAANRTAEGRAADRATDDEETVRFSVAALSAAAGKTGLSNLSGRELHITELLRREGRAGEEERGGGFSVPKLVAMASGGVVLAGTVAFTATNLMSSPDERPLAEVRFDARPAARATNTLTKDLAAAAQQQAQQTQAETTTTTPEQAPETTTQRTQRPTTQQTTTTTQQQTQQAPSSTTTQPPSSSSQPTTTPPPPSTTTPAPPSDSTQPPSSSTPPPSSSNPSTPPSDDGSGLDLGLELDLGGILNPIGGFDFFAPAS